MFSLDLAVNAVVAGLLLGCFYAAVTIGVTISFGMLDIVNFAHPAFVMLVSLVIWVGLSGCDHRRERRKPRYERARRRRRR
jgi:branched-subunit amino acid ABC-type transport system permease component